MCIEQVNSYNVPVPILAAVISSITAALVAWLMNRKSRRDQELSELHSLVTQINLIAISYPVLEDDDSCAKWPTNSPPTETDMRYDNYCCLVFNLLERIWKHFEADDRQIKDFFGAVEMIQRHRKWWLNHKNRLQNYGGYDIDFVKYVDSNVKGVS